MFSVFEVWARKTNHPAMPDGGDSWDVGYSVLKSGKSQANLNEMGSLWLINKCFPRLSKLLYCSLELPYSCWAKAKLQQEWMLCWRFFSSLLWHLFLLVSLLLLRDATFLSFPRAILFFKLIAKSFLSCQHKIVLCPNCSQPCFLPCEDRISCSS